MTDPSTRDTDLRAADVTRLVALGEAIRALPVPACGDLSTDQAQRVLAFVRVRLTQARQAALGAASLTTPRTTTTEEQQP